MTYLFFLSSSSIAAGNALGPDSLALRVLPTLLVDRDLDTLLKAALTRRIRQPLSRRFWVSWQNMAPIWASRAASSG